MTENKEKLTKISDLQITKLKSHGDLVNSESLWLANFTSKQTKRTYSAAFRECCTLLGVTNSESFRALTSAEIIVYRDWLIKQGKSNRSVRNRLAAISSCFKFLVSKHEIEINPVDGVERPKVDESSGETPALTPDQGFFDQKTHLSSNSAVTLGITAFQPKYRFQNTKWKIHNMLNYKRLSIV